MLFPTLGPSSLPVVVAQPDERHANRAASVLEWYDRHRALKKNREVKLAYILNLDRDFEYNIQVQYISEIYFRKDRTCRFEIYYFIELAVA